MSCNTQSKTAKSNCSTGTVHNAVSQWGGVDKVPISKRIILSARNARRRNLESLDEQIKKEENNASKEESKTRNKQLVRELEEKKTETNSFLKPKRPCSLL